LNKIKFGTDGWRAIIDKEFTFENVKAVSQAVADYVNSVKDPEELRGKELIVGYDSRRNSKEYADDVASVLAANGIKVLLTDRITPTPAISFAIKQKRLTGGVIITASHNPADYNGYKYKAFYSGSADPDIIGKIEANISRNAVKAMPHDEAKKKGLLKMADVIPAHLDFIKNYVDLEMIKRSGLKVLVNTMHGAGGRYIEELLAGGNCKVETVNADRDVTFGGVNPEPIAKYLGDFMPMTRDGGYDIGLATDGDVDRIGCALPDGRFMDAQYIMSLLLWHFVEDKKITGSVVSTICGTEMLKNICKKYKLKLHITPVGFKYICDIMRREDVLIGGEEAGGIGFKDFIPERDGILSGLLLLEMMAHRKKSILGILSDMQKEFGTYYYMKTSTKVTDDIKKRFLPSLRKNPLKEVLGRKVVNVDTLDGIKFVCEDSTWLLFRLSGTEPILRVYSEAHTEERASEMLEYGKKVATEI
jgi:alpha-D-glucose phosphate-specific phosphoglucomutase